MSKLEGNIFSRGKPVGQKFLILIALVYEVWNSIEQEFDGVTGFLDDLSLWFNKWV